MAKIATKESRIKKEYKKLKELFQNLPENKMKLCEPLIQNAAYMKATLEDLQAKVNEEGAVIKNTNGNGFEVTQENPAQKSYVATLGKYNTVISQLSEMLPPMETKSKFSEFIAMNG